MINKLVYILSSGHSGSTLLELILTNHESCIGIGESFHMFFPLDSMMEHIQIRQCSCGESILKCNYWSKVIQELKARPHLSNSQKYGLFIDTMNELHPDKTVLVDSSKQISTLKTILEVDNPLEVKVLHLIRDVRAYTVSIKKSYKRNKELGIPTLGGNFSPRGILRALRRTSMANFYLWRRENENFFNFISDNKLSSLTVSYEKICFDFETTMRKICDFIGIDYNNNMENISESYSHNIFGNRMKTDKEKRSKIKYDYSWMNSSTWKLPSLLMPGVMKLNRRIHDK